MTSTINYMVLPSWEGRVVTCSQSHSQTQSKGEKTNVSLSSSSEELEDSEVVDPVILVPSTRDKEPLDCRSMNAVKDEEPEANRTMAPQQTMPTPQQRGISLNTLPSDDGRRSESGRGSHRWCSHQKVSDDLQSSEFSSPSHRSLRRNTIED